LRCEAEVDMLETDKIFSDNFKISRSYISWKVRDSNFKTAAPNLISIWHEIGVKTCKATNAGYTIDTNRNFEDAEWWSYSILAFACSFRYFFSTVNLQRKDTINNYTVSCFSWGTRWRSGWGTVLQTGRSRDRFRMVSLEIFIDIILPTALWPWGRISL
jgi:hypothetical protein